jgi:hypothetical protein
LSGPGRTETYPAYALPTPHLLIVPITIVIRDTARCECIALLVHKSAHSVRTYSDFVGVIVIVSEGYRLGRGESWYRQRQHQQS